MNIFRGMKILWIFWGGDHHKIGLYIGVISMPIRVLSFKVNVQNGGRFRGLQKF